MRLAIDRLDQFDLHIANLRGGDQELERFSEGIAVDLQVLHRLLSEGQHRPRADAERVDPGPHALLDVSRYEANLINPPRPVALDKFLVGHGVLPKTARF